MRWVTNMHHRWGSCTITDRTIRLSHRLQSMPSWVIDYVLVHELCHLLEPGHDRAFWAWAERYPAHRTGPRLPGGGGGGGSAAGAVGLRLAGAGLRVGRVVGCP